MAKQVTNYQCPACGGPLHFSGKEQKLACDYCGSQYAVAEVEELYRKRDEAAAAAEQKETAAGNGWGLAAESDWGGESAKMRAYSCPSCGAELVCEETTAATSCPYCGNPSIIPGQFSGMLKPDLVLPFKLDKQAAMEALRGHYKGKKLLPRFFASENHIEEIKGIYVPFWLFDGKANADLRFAATRSHTIETRDERVTTTEHFALRRRGSVAFERIPVDASSKMPDAHMDSIEPFDYADLKPFSTAYLPGYMAEKYDVSVEDSAARADERVTRSTYDAMRGSCMGYDTVTAAGGSVTLERGQVHYALLPVWMLNTRWKGKDFLFAMNGQTGKLIGDLPVDKGRYWKYFLLTTAIVTVVVTAAMTFLL